MNDNWDDIGPVAHLWNELSAVGYLLGHSGRSRVGAIRYVIRALSEGYLDGLDTRRREEQASGEKDFT